MLIITKSKHESEMIHLRFKMYRKDYNGTGETKNITSFL